MKNSFHKSNSYKVHFTQVKLLSDVCYSGTIWPRIFGANLASSRSSSQVVKPLFSFTFCICNKERSKKAHTYIHIHIPMYVRVDRHTKSRARESLICPRDYFTLAKRRKNIQEIISLYLWTWVHPSMAYHVHVRTCVHTQLRWCRWWWDCNLEKTSSLCGNQPEEPAQLDLKQTDRHCKSHFTATKNSCRPHS